MKKLFGVMILSGLPVACGSTLPSTPDAAGILTSDNAAVAAQANRPGPRPTPAPGPRQAPAPLPTSGCADDADVQIDGIQISILSDDARSVTLRADAVVLHSDRPAPCFVPVWSVGSSQRGVSLTTDKSNPQVATLVGPAGRYSVQAAWNTADGKSIVGSATVTIQ